MLLAIDVGNTKTAFGVWSENKWIDIHQWPSQSLNSNPELIEWLTKLRLGSPGIRVTCASVNPSAEPDLISAVANSLGADVHFLRTAEDFQLKSLYSSELGADRMANIIGALDQFKPPLIVIDVGTATTIDAVDNDGVHVGGVILAGPQFSIDALLAKSPLMKRAAVHIHQTLFSLNTADALSNGHFLGHYFALEGIVCGMKLELEGKVEVLTTGGQGSQFCELSLELGNFHPNLTLEGIRIAATSSLNENS